MTESNIEGESESKVLFLDGETPRALKGIIVSEDKEFIVLRRRDGVVRIAKRFVIKIETKKRSDADGNSRT
ncbi:MAG: hypothetical protein KAR39_06970 [Thermoplasmata archaeon]|nr:hypothetical protein [Thermoplasmata archaeon]